MHTFKLEDLEMIASKSSSSSEVSVTKLPYRFPKKGSDSETISYSIADRDVSGGAKRLMRHFAEIAKENGFTPTFILDGIPPCAFTSQDKKTGILVTARNDRIQFILSYYP